MIIPKVVSHVESDCIVEIKKNNWKSTCSCQAVDKRTHSIFDGIDPYVAIID